MYSYIFQLLCCCGYHDNMHWPEQLSCWIILIQEFLSTSHYNNSLHGAGVLTSGTLMANKESLIARFSYDTPVKSDYFRAFLRALSILCLWHLHFIYCMYKLSNGNDYMHLDSRMTLEFRKCMRQNRTYPESISFSTLTLRSIMLWIDQ